LEYDRLKGVYVLTRRKLDMAKKDLLVMHPLPRVDEIAVDVDNDPRAVYFEQARFGMFIRMALLLKTSHMPRIKPEPVEPAKELLCPNKVCITQFEKYLPDLKYKSQDGMCCGYCDKKLKLL
jgi:aspartate carbamoyltransferase catalytic subunit